jgi:hypothetical protein
MPCDSCSSKNVTEFTVEMMIPLSAHGSAEDPGVLAIPKVLICMSCGAARFAISDAELRELRERPSAA